MLIYSLQMASIHVPSPGPQMLETGIGGPRCGSCLGSEGESKVCLAASQNTSNLGPEETSYFVMLTTSEDYECGICVPWSLGTAWGVLEVWC